MNHSQPDLNGNSFSRIEKVLFKQKSPAKKIDFVEPLREVWEWKADKAA